MITRRISTKMSPEPPVRFYKTIAITFLFLTIALLAIVIFFTAKKATILIAAKSDNKNINISVEVGSVSGTGLISGISGSISSTEYAWSKKFYPSGSKIVEGTAVGEVILINDSGIGQPLVKTTRLLTDDGVLFRLSERANVPAHGSVKAQVYADQLGGSGDIGPSSFTIPGLNNAKQKLIYAKSTEAFSGGVRKVGFLTSDDLDAAEINYLAELKKQFSSSSSSAPISLNNREKVVSIGNQQLSSDKKIGDEIDGFTVSGTSTILTVYYDQNELQSLISREISSKIDTDSEKILSMQSQPQVSLSNISPDYKSARLSVYQDVLVTLDANASKLAAVNFFGKSKDEIERYVMGLSHVVGVDVKFSPTWMRTSPSVNEKIKVVVKNVK
ncbi:MAG: hypothetical protein ABH832_02390 [bacterium]